MTSTETLLEPLSLSLSLDAARQILQLRLSVEIQARIEDLADRCHEGLLTVEERAEYENYVRGVGLLNLLRAKVRFALQTAPAARSTPRLSPRFLS